MQALARSASKLGPAGITVTVTVTVTVSASGARGKADGNDVTQSNTQLVAGNQIALASGNDTTLKGAVASAAQVTAKVGGNLNIESLQDTSQFASKQQSIGASVTIGAGAGGSISASKSTVKSDFASVTQQSGIRAGDGGFDVQVKGNTDLKGGAITSTQAAIDQNLSRFETGGTLTTSDIQNKADYKASAIGFSAGTSGNLGGALKPSGTSIGFGKDSGSASSTTQAAISGIAGNKNARTGDKETGIQKIFDADKVQKEIDAQVVITQTFGREAPKAAADFADGRKNALIDQAVKETDPEKRQSLLDEADKWKEGGAYRAALQAVVGGLGGGVQGALSAGATSLAAPLLNELQSNIAQKLKKVGVSDAVAQLAGQTVSLATASGIGAVAGGGNVSGIAGAFNVDANNRLLHANEIGLIKVRTKDFAKRLNGGKEPTQQQVDQAETRLLDQADRNVNQHSDLRLDGVANQFLTDLKRELVKAGQDHLPNGGQYFFASPGEYFDDTGYIETLNTPLGQQAYAKINGGQFGTYLPQYYYAQGIVDANKEAKRQLIAGAVGGAVALAPAIVTVCLANPVACNQAGITTSEILSEGGIVAGGAVATKKVLDEAAALKQGSKVAETLEVAGGNTEQLTNKLANTLEFRKRTLELARDPDRNQLLIREGIGAARFEQATGRTVVRSADGATDFVDSKLGAFDLKGPIRANDGSPIPITPERVNGLAESVIKEANRSTASKAVVVDTLGLSKEQVAALKTQVANEVKSNKPIIFIE